MSELLEIEVENKEGMQVLTSTIAKMFQEAGPEICLKVKEPQIRRILQLVFEGGEIGRADLVSALCSIAVVTHSLNVEFMALSYYGASVACTPVYMDPCTCTTDRNPHTQTYTTTSVYVCVGVLVCVCSCDSEA